MNDLEKTIVGLLKQGVYDQNEIFRTIYPTYFGHYSTLRNAIAKVKNDGI